MSEILKLKNIHCGYGNRAVIKGISLKITPNEVVLLAGPNGCGKSTLLKTITGLVNLDRGEIIFNGDNISKLPIEKRINQGIGYLSQIKNIFPSLTVMDNLELSGIYMTGTELKNSIGKILSIFSFLKKHLDRRAGTLSGGQRQALAIAMILMHPRKLYLLDEPTAGLSPKAAIDIIEKIKNFANETDDCSVVIVEHRLELLKWVNRAIILSQGEIKTEIDDISLLFDAGWLAEHYF